MPSGGKAAAMPYVYAAIRAKWETASGSIGNFRKVFTFISMSTAGEMNELFGYEIEYALQSAKQKGIKSPTNSFNNCIQFANQRAPNDANYGMPGPCSGPFPHIPRQPVQPLVGLKSLGRALGHGLWSHSSATSLRHPVIRLRRLGTRKRCSPQLMIPKNWYFIYVMRGRRGKIITTIKL